MFILKYVPILLLYALEHLIILVHWNNLIINLFVLPEILCQQSIWIVSWTLKQLHFKLVMQSTIPRQVSVVDSELNSNSCICEVVQVLYYYYILLWNYNEHELGASTFMVPCILLFGNLAFLSGQKTIGNTNITFYISNFYVI